MLRGYTALRASCKSTISSGLLKIIGFVILSETFCHPLSSFVILCHPLSSFVILCHPLSSLAAFLALRSITARLFVSCDIASV